LKTCYFFADKIITPYRTLEDGFIKVKNGIIVSVGEKKQVKKADAETLDLHNSLIVPGFIDIHTHGIAGVDTMDAKEESIRKMSIVNAAHGVTAFLPTTVCAPYNALINVIKTVVNVKRKQNMKAKVLGLNLEGPFISPKKLGAMDPNYARPPSIKEFDKLWKASDGLIKLITIAPEVSGALELVRHVTSRGVTVAMGHSYASYQETMDCIRAGARHTTHLFNAMRAYGHREPGIVGAVLESAVVSTEVIADLIHLHPTTLRLTCAMKPEDKVVLVTDAIQATDMPDGMYKLGKKEIYVKKGVSRLADGTLAGSTLTMEKAVRNMVFEVGVPLEQAVAMATVNPAKVLGIENEVGSLESGKCADFAVLDKNLNVVSTFVDGKAVFN